MGAPGSVTQYVRWFRLRGETEKRAFKAAVSKVYKYPLFLTSEEIEKFAATPVLKPDGGVVRWNPPQSAIMP